MSDMKTDPFMIDEITWHDLDMDEIVSRIDIAKSSVGSEYIRQTLKTPEFRPEKLKKRSSFIRFFQNHETETGKISKCFSWLGRTKKVSFLDYIFKLKEVPEKGNGLHFVLIILLLLAIALIFVLPAAGIVAFVVMIAVNIIVYFKQKAGIEGYFICLKYLVSMVVCAQKILSSGVLEDPVFAEEKETLRHCVQTFAGLKAGSFLITNSVSGSLVDVIMDYIRMIFHVDLIKFNSMRKTAMDKEEEIRMLYSALGELELAISIAAFRNQAEGWCEPVFYNREERGGAAANALIAVELYHPLIDHPVKNTIRTERSVLLTGSNASGKSTFLKTVAVNQIFAQTIFTCLSDQFITTYYKVLSSMALSDNLLGQESYFVVEVKSLKRLFDALGDVPVMGFVDEVLRGTNTIERISASSRILESLSDKNALLFAATHDIELTGLLKEKMDNYHFSETVEEQAVSFDYKIKEGAADTSNAIRLLDAFGFDKEIVQSASERASVFREKGVWV